MTPVTQEELNMGKDTGWKRYFSDNRRYADIINGIGCAGMQLVKGTDLCEVDGQTQNGKNRDLLRKAALGVNFVLLGIENQETIDYAIPLRVMNYDVAEYEKQAAQIRRKVRKQRNELATGEYLYGYRKDSRLSPVITFVLYGGKEAWDGPNCLHELLDFTDMPKSLQDMTSNYKMNLIEIRKLQDTSVFQTDVRQVFEFIKCSEDKNALRRLVEEDAYYQCMEEDAFDVAVMYTNSTELVAVKDYQRKDGKVNMCTAITELIADGKREGMELGVQEGIKEGIKEGESLFANLMSRLFADERMEDARLAATDEDARLRFYQEYGMRDSN